MDCSVLYNVTQNELNEMFQNTTNSNYIVGFLSLMAIGCCSAFFCVIDRKFNRLINGLNRPPVYSERA